MRGNNSSSGKAVKILWLSVLFILLVLVAAPAYSADITLSTVIEYDGTNLPFNNGDTVYVEKNGQIKINSGMELNLANCNFIFNNDPGNPDNNAKWRVFRTDGGTLNLTNCNFQNAPINGAININGGTLTINGGEFTNNKSDVGGAIRAVNADVTIRNASFTGNYASKGGGAIYIDNSTVTITNSNFSGNSAKISASVVNDNESGGAILAASGTTTIIGGTFGGPGYTENIENNIVTSFTTTDGNIAYKGGAIYQAGGTLILGDESDPSNTAKAPKFIGNFASSNGSSNTSLKPRGGAIAVGGNGTLLIYNAEFSHNSAERQAGALEIGDYDKNSDVFINQAKFIGNSVTNGISEGMAGGAIMIHEGNSLTMSDAVLCNNYVHNAQYGNAGGGAIATCAKGDTHVFSVGGVAVFDNITDVHNVPGNKGNLTYSDVYIFYDNDFNPYPDEKMFTSHDHNWNVYDEVYREDSSTTGSYHQANPDASLPRASIEAQAKVLFKQNSVQGYGKDNGNGGAIGNNGHLNIGTDLTDLAITKNWEDDQNSYHTRLNVLEFLQNIKLTTDDGEPHFLQGIQPDTGNPTICVRDQITAEQCYRANWKIYQLIIAANDTNTDKWQIDIYGLPMKISGNNANWNLSENAPNNYIIQGNIEKTVIPPSDPDGNEEYSFELTNALDLVSIEGKKVWNGDSTSVRPASINVYLMADGVSMKGVPGMELTVYPDNTGEYKWKFNNLPKYNANRSEINYVVREDPLTDYISISDPSSYNKTDPYAYTDFDITNEYKVGSTQLDVIKQWDDESNWDGLRPASVTVKLLANGVEYLDKSGAVVTRTINEAGGWIAEFTDLPERDSQGQPITYTAVEINGITGYTPSGQAETAARTYEIRNTHTLETTNLLITKYWDDDNNFDKNRPGISLEAFTIYADGVPFVLRDVEWVLDQGNYVYKAQSDAGEVTILVTTGGNTWIISYSGLPKYAKDSREIQWSVRENAPDGYTAIPSGIQACQDGNGSFNCEITNHKDYTYIAINKNWDDNGNIDGRPEVLEFLSWLQFYYDDTLYTHSGFEILEENNGDYRIKMLTTGNDFVEIYLTKYDNSNSWSILVEGLPNLVNGKKVVWTIQENIPYTANYLQDGEIKKTGGDLENTFEITNKWNRVNLSLTKTWQDNNNKFNTRPDAFDYLWSLKLYANNKEYVLENPRQFLEQHNRYEADFVYDTNVYDTILITVNDNGNNTWTVTYEGLPMIDPETKKLIVWRVEESDWLISDTEVQSYYELGEVSEPQVDSDGNYSFSVTNTIRETDLSITKQWVGDTPEVRPEAEDFLALLTLKNDVNDSDNIVLDGNLEAVPGSAGTWQVSGTNVRIAVTDKGDNTWTVNVTGLPLMVFEADENAYVVANWSVEEAPIMVDSVNGTFKQYLISYEPDNVITNTYNVVSLSGEKQWDYTDGEGNTDTNPPQKIYVHLHVNGQHLDGSTKEVTAGTDGKWKWEYTSLPKLDSEGNVIDYEIQESWINHYIENASSRSVDNNGNISVVIKNKYEPKFTQLKVFKVWNDDGNRDGLREPVTITLLADGNPIDSVTLEVNKYDHEFTGLPIYSDAGVKIVYTVREDTQIDGYTMTGPIELKDGNVVIAYEFTNSHMVEETEVKITKVWTDKSNLYGLRPDVLDYLSKVHLYADDVDCELIDFDTVPGSSNQYTANSMFGTITIDFTDNGNDTWTLTYSGLPKNNIDSPDAIVWSISEDSIDYYRKVTEIIPGNTQNGNEFMLENVLWDTQFNITKIWEGDTAETRMSIQDFLELLTLKNNINSNADIVLAGKITADPAAANAYQVTGTDVVITVADNHDSSWSVHVSGLPLMVRDSFGIYKEAVWSVDEALIQVPYLNDPDNGTFNKYLTEITGNPVGGYEITNKLNVVDISGVKNWDHQGDESEEDEYPPVRIEVHLHANGVPLREISTITVIPDENLQWKWEFTNLPKYDDEGEEIRYEVHESWINNYTSTFHKTTAADGTVSYDIANVYTPYKTHLKVYKVWNDDDDRDGLRQPITINLLADGKVIKSVTLDKNLDEYQFTGLDIYSAEGTPIVYTITENSISGYDAPVIHEILEGDVKVGYTITNTHQIEYADVAVTKTWDDNSNQFLVRPSVEDLVEALKLCADGKPYPLTDLQPNGNGQFIAKGSAGSVMITVSGMDGNSWIVSYAGLPKKDLNTHEEMIWTVKEEPSGDSFAYYKDGVISGLNVTNTIEDTKLTLTKKWLDDKASDRPDIKTFLESLTLKNSVNAASDIALAEKVTDVSGSVNTYQVSGTNVVIVVRDNRNNTWTVNISRLPLMVENTSGVYEEASWTVTESLPNYFTEITGTTITNKPELTSLTLTKVWDDSSNAEGKRPDPLSLLRSIELFTNMEPFTPGVFDMESHEGTTWVFRAAGSHSAVTATLVEKDQNTWEITYDRLPRFLNGYEIVWTAEEDVYGYRSVVSGDMESGIVITNTLDLVTVSGKKTWNFTSADGVTAPEDERPEQIIIHLHANGSKIDEMIVTADNNWSWRFEDLPKYDEHGALINYSIHEQFARYYEETVEGFNITNTYSPNHRSLDVYKVWDDDGNRDGLRTDEVTVFLMADGVKIEEAVLNDANGWHHEFTNLDVFLEDNVTEIVYTIEEDPGTVPAGYTIDVTGNMDEGIIITNSYAPETVNIEGRKQWNDSGNEGARPASITVRLHANGQEIKKVTTTERDNWAWSFRDLPKNENGKEILYTVTEDAIENYDTSIDENSFTIINTYDAGKTSLPVSKVWLDNENADGLRPASVVVELLKDGEYLGKYLELNESNKWTGIFTELDETRNGNPIHYTIREQEISGYHISITGNASRGYTITNTLENETIEIIVVKVWDDEDNRNNLRPDSITVVLLADGREINSMVLNERNNWRGTFSDLPKYADDGVTEIRYTVTENPVPDHYSLTVDDSGQTIIVLTNTYTETPPERPRPRELPRTGISGNVKFTLDQKPASVKYTPVNMELMIPGLELTAPIVMVDQIDGTYPVEWLENNVGLMSETALPGKGISVIAGHNTLSAEEYGPFAAISTLEVGDRFFVRTAENRLLSFEVYANAKVGSDDVDGLYSIASRYDSSLTLLTCEDELPEGGYASRRLIAAKPR